MNPRGKYSMTDATANVYRVYRNANAKDLYIKAQKAATTEERKRLFDEMGDYEIIDKTPKKKRKNRFLQFLKGIFSSD